jgi:hypothetical protein
MRILRINDIDVDIDDKTAIGIDFQSYDMKEPGKNFVNVSNTFTIPATANNKAIFGNASDPQSLSTLIYEESICNYWVDNEQLIKNAKCRVEQIQDRISIFVFQKDDIWDIMKGIKWEDFVPDYLYYLQFEKGLPSRQFFFSGTWLEFLTVYANTTEGIILPFYFGNFYGGIPGGNIETIDEIYINASFTWEGGHFCTFVKTIFEYLEFTYNVNFLTSGGVLPGNIWDDPFASSVYIPIREITAVHSDSGSPFCYFDNVDVTSELFTPLKDQRDKQGKTLYEMATSFFQHFNIVIDQLEVNGEDVIRLARFDDLEITAEVVDWSGNISGKPLFKPSIEGIFQNNIIKFSSIYPEGDKLINSKTLTSLNVNLDYSKELIDIDAYIPSFVEITDGVVPDLSITESFKTFQFFINDGKTTDNITVNVSNEDITSASLKLYKAALYSLDSEYNYYDEIIDYPKYYEIEKWLKPYDLKNFEFFKQYFVRELNGSFFVNKIEGFNPDKSKEATKIELIKISDRTPPIETDFEYWTDGLGTEFVDGDLDYFY